VVVLPLVPEFIRNEDGKEKQDCERNAAKQWINRHKERYGPLNITILGNDLYACHAICASLVEAGMQFLLNCKDESHPWIAEQVRYAEPETYERREWNHRNHLVYRYRWVKGIENRTEGEKLLVNYLYFELYNEEEDKITYKNSWITNHDITEENVRGVAECGRAQWKIEHEHNNELKHHGYNLKHNFGHGENHANEVFCMLNLPAFLFHGIQGLTDGGYRRGPGFFWKEGRLFPGITLRDSALPS
jgi:hypothetical protein